jgi:hypothetical protein
MGASGAESPARKRHSDDHVSNEESSKEQSMRGPRKYIALLLATVISAVSIAAGPAAAAAFIAMPQPAVTVRP